MTAMLGPGTIKKQLEDKRRELCDALANRDALCVLQPLSDADAIGLAVERAVTMAELDRKSTLLREVIRALDRLRSNDYGSCVCCGNEIGVARLLCVPWTSHCLRCQETIERASEESRSSFGDSAIR